MKHTLWHEIGHIKCGHKKHSEREEIEAHFFAAQANAPNILIKAISQRGYSINVPFLVECFGLSKEAAEKKWNIYKNTVSIIVTSMMILYSYNLLNI